MPIPVTESICINRMVGHLGVIYFFRYHVMPFATSLSKKSIFYIDWIIYNNNFFFSLYLIHSVLVKIKNFTFPLHNTEDSHMIERTIQQ